MRNERLSYTKDLIRDILHKHNVIFVVLYVINEVNRKSRADDTVDSLNMYVPEFVKEIKEPCHSRWLTMQLLNSFFYG